MKIIIVGGVAAGATLATRLRRNNEEDEIIIFEKDQYVAYANCGLPYYVGDVIKSRDELLIQSVEGLKKRYNIDVRINSEVIKINETDKTVEVINNKQKYTQSYDKLILATGAKPIVYKFSASNLFTIRSIDDMDKIKQNISKDIKDVIVVGGGFIGVEMAENFNNLGLNVTIVESSSHILKNFDMEMAAIIETNLKQSGIKILLKQKIIDITEDHLTLENGDILSSDMILLAMGVNPLSSLANNSTIKLANNGAFLVDEYFQTSNKDIYALGDAINVNSPIINQEIYVPLAGPANHQARLLADIINGDIVKKYNGSIATNILKVNDITAASVGFSSEFLTSNNIKHQHFIIHIANHATYYPNSSTTSIKIIFDITTKQILGAQAIGKSGVDKRIDIIATAIKAKMKVDELQSLELSYAPPYGSAKDPINILGYVAENIIYKKTNISHYSDVFNFKNIIDVRQKIEYEHDHIRNSINYSIEELRDIDLKINKDEEILVYCQVGRRGYIAEQILKAKGYTKVYNLSGGFTTYNYYYNNLNKNSDE